MRIAATGAVIGLALLAGCAPVQGPAPAGPSGPEPTVVVSSGLAGMRCLVVAPFENTSDLPSLGDVATSALVASLDPEQTRLFPVEDLRRLFRGTSLELPPDGVSPRLALALAEKVKADGVLYGAVEGRAQGSSTAFVVSVRLQATAGRELLFASDATVKPAEGELVEVAMRRGLLLGVRSLLLKIGAPGEKHCFDPELVRRARVIRAAPVAAALGLVPVAEPAEPPRPEAAQAEPQAASSILPAPAAAAGLAATTSPATRAPAPVAVAAAPIVVRKGNPRSARQAEIARQLEQGSRFVLEDVEFAGRTAVFARNEGLTDLSRALAGLPSTNVRIEVFVDGTDDPSQDARASMAQAMAVTRRLVALGVARERIAQEARGGEDPLVPNFTSRGRAANRRVEIVGVKRR